MDRRKFLGTLAALPVGLSLSRFANAESFSNNKTRSNVIMGKFELPKLSYSYDALEPYVDARTMEIHHSKHHQGYVNKLNNAVEGSDAEGKSLDELMKNVSKYSTGVRNNGGGHYNHSLFWEVMGPGSDKPSGELADAINSAFGSFDEFKKKFSEAALGRFGSGWAWLIVKDDGNLAITDTPNQDSPVMDIADVKGTPILNIDVWEHAYYLKYQNKRNEYVENWFNVVNWDAVAKKFADAK